MQTISMRLPDNLVAELNRQAKARRITKTALIRDSIEQSLRAVAPAAESCFDLAADLAGSVRGLPKDIATNPRHMKGYGE